MIFGPRPIQDCVGCLLAHAIRRDGIVLKKGTRLTARDVEALRALDVIELVVAQLEPGDVGENDAAHQMAMAAAGDHVRVEDPFTGRANLYAKTSGLLMLDAPGVHAVNGVEESVTLATLPPLRLVRAGEMVATVKIIPLAVAGAVMAEVQLLLQRPLVSVAPFKPAKISVISTLLPGLKHSTIDKTLSVLDGRLADMGVTRVAETRVAHTAEAVAHAVQTMLPQCDVLILYGASAITDRQDVIPAGIETAGGSLVHFGMPVDPGNLLLLARGPQGQPIIGAPGCARSPKENGFDWVLQRVLADVPVTSADIRAMGVGGLLMEIAARPQLRAGSQAEVEQQAGPHDGP